MKYELVQELTPQTIRVRAEEGENFLLDSLEFPVAPKETLRMELQKGLKEAVKQSNDIDAPGFDDKTGAGRVNAYKAVKAAFVWRREKNIPPGTIVAFAGMANAVPDGWFLCDGRAVPRFQYQSLFFAIGTGHGQGDGSTSFNLPDYRGYFLRGADLGTGTDVDAAVRTSLGPVPPNEVGSMQGDATRVPSDLLVEQGGAHSHRYSYPSYHLSGATPLGGYSSGNKDVYQQNNIKNTTGASAHSHGITGGNRETRPKNKNVNWIIKY